MTSNATTSPMRKEPTVSFRRKETQKQFSPVLHGSQVSKPYKCRRPSIASYAGLRLGWSVGLGNEVSGKLQTVSDCSNARSDKSGKDYSA